jgi:preprotein translocase subunit SecY
MHLLAPNGIRFCYDYAAHIEKAQEVAEQMKRALPFLPNVKAEPDALL